ncbi:hypothetical protein CBD41_04810 [bacterium TMED181]|nr:hypothetical protein [Planctomycetota bacterium]OUW44906.1 MAG: hypothetical protein CBD41_04810 [bacterium TMED181]
MNFINPALLGFLALGTIPIIIYLINRQRYRRRPWAAMEFLLRAMKRHQRRLRLENLLLLIIRTLALLLFVFAMARPSLDDGTLPVIGRAARQEAVIFDASSSMAAKLASRTTLQAAREEARSLLLNLEVGDRTALFVGGLPPVETPTPQLELVAEGGPAEILGDLEQIKAGWLNFEPESLISEAAAFSQEQGGAWIFHVISDFQRGDWYSEDGTERPAVKKALDFLEKSGSELQLHNVAPENPRNVSLVSLRPSSGLISTDLPISFQVELVNRGTEMVPGIEVELLIDGEVQGTRRVDVEGGEEITLSFPHIFRLPGVARVESRLRSDDLDRDDARWFACEVVESVKILVADGGWNPVEESTESDWLLAAIGEEETSGSGIRLSPYRVEVVQEDLLLSADLDSARILVLADVSTMNPAESARIDQFIREGGGVLVFTGSRMDHPTWGTNAWNNGDGWFLWEPGTSISDPRRQVFYHWLIKDPEHPMMEYLANFPEAGLGDVIVHGFQKPLRLKEDTEVLLELDDFDQTPVLVQGYRGNGSIVVLGTGADREWSNFPVTPAYVCFLHECLPWLTMQDGSWRYLALGQPLVKEVSSADYAPRVSLITPEGGVVPLALKESEDRKSFLLSVAGSWLPGVYEIRYEKDSGEIRSDAFAVNPTVGEGELVFADISGLAEVYPAVEVEDLESASDREGRGGNIGDLWYPLFSMVLMLLVLETGLASFFSKARRRS